MDFVDLGLPSGLQWATCNVGATKPEEYGLYFAWGEAEGYQVTNNGGLKIFDSNGNEQTNKSGFTWNDYKLCKGTSMSLTKYNTNSSYGIVDNLTALELMVNNDCKIPTQENFKELIDNTTSSWETVNDIYCLKLTSNIEGYTDKSIFFPTAGCVRNGSLHFVGSNVYVWSSNLDISDSRLASFMYAFSGGIKPFSYCARFLGNNMRFVLSKDK